MKFVQNHPDILIINTDRLNSYTNIFKYWEQGQQVVRIDFNLKGRHLSIQSFNSEGIKYASINCEVDDEIRAWDMVSRYLGSSQKFDLIIHLNDKNDQDVPKLLSFLKNGGRIFGCSSASCINH